MISGFPRSDAEHDFLRARRRQVMARLSAWLLREPDDINMMLPFDELIATLGRKSERRVGLKVITLDDIVGGADQGHDFDRRLRPTSDVARERWEHLAAASRRGEPIPPIEVYQIGELYFVADGHHRVSVARSLGHRSIEAYVTEVRTELNPSGIRGQQDLILKDSRRIFLERVPLEDEARTAVALDDPWHYALLGEHVEAWGFRLMQEEGALLYRATVAARWYDEEFVPVVEMLQQAQLIGTRSPAEAYLRVAGERYKLIRTHRWDEEVITALRERLR